LPSDVKRFGHKINADEVFGRSGNLMKWKDQLNGGGGQSLDRVNRRLSCQSASAAPAGLGDPQRN
jgi:hypothetical protein